MELDESNAGDLLRTLESEPPRPPSIDIGRAMRDGRRHRLLRRTALTGGALGLTMLAMAAVPVALAVSNRSDIPPATGATGAPPSAAARPSGSAAPQVSAAPRASQPAQPKIAAPASCKVEKLPVPDNVAQALVTAADPTGKIIFGRSYPKAGDHQVLVWQDGKATKIDFPGNDQAIDSVNAAGVGVGSSYGDAESSAWLYRDGKVTKLPGGDGATADGINASNVIVGTRARRPLVWRTPESEPTPLTLPEEANGGEAQAIDDDGTVVGAIHIGTDSVAYAWAPDGTGRRLPVAGEVAKGGSTAYTVRNGWATGINGLMSNGGGDSGQRWNLSTGQVETTPGLFIRPSTANASGWLVGTDAQGRGVLVAGDKRIVLPDGYIHKPGGLSNIPETISDDGRILAGQADDTGGTIHAVVWRCS